MFKIPPQDELNSKWIPLCILCAFIFYLISKQYIFAAFYFVGGCAYWKILTYMKEKKLGIYKDVE